MRRFYFRFLRVVAIRAVTSIQLVGLSLVIALLALPKRCRQSGCIAEQIATACDDMSHFGKVTR